MDESAERFEAIDARVAGVYNLLQRVADALQSQKDRIDEAQARLDAHVVLTGALIQALRSVAPESTASIVSLLEQTERDFVRTHVHAMTIRELREILGALRAQQGAHQQTIGPEPNGQD